MKKRAAFAIIFFLGYYTTIAQKAKPEAVSAGGGRFVSSAVSLTWTLGETAIDSYGAGKVLLTQGFHQPVLKVVSVEEAPEYKDILSVYPNPAITHITVKLSDGRHYRLELRNLTGELVYEANATDELHRIDMQNMANGMYILSVYSEAGRAVASYKIQKKN